MASQLCDSKKGPRSADVAVIHPKDDRKWLKPEGAGDANRAWTVSVPVGNITNFDRTLPASRSD